MTSGRRESGDVTAWGFETCAGLWMTSRSLVGEVLPATSLLQGKPRSRMTLVHEQRTCTPNVTPQKKNIYIHI